ncbi:MAG: hypothetical protein H6766_03255 [Candidatus Peribacteria bacterium]|nr:MAG: hypothetical protein H6766_03255 [Candidatus Peribacteria bacterium]
MSLTKILSDARQRKSTRIWFMILLLVIIIVLYFTVGKMKGLLIGLAIIILAAIGIQVMDYDIDLGKMIETGGNIQASRVQHTNDGVTLYGSCVTDDLNCIDFTTQAQAQEKYQGCMDQILKNNPNITDLNELDVYGLDGDNDGIVCEALPAG